MAIYDIKNFFYSIITGLCLGAFADPITIYNTTARDLDMAIYYLRMEAVIAQIATPIYSIAAGASAQINRPDGWLGYDLELVFVEDQMLLAATLSATDLNTYHSKSVSDLQGSTFYLGDDEGDIYGYNALEWDVYHTSLELAQQQLVSMLPAITNNPYKDAPASIRIGNDLCEQEQNYLVQRLPKIQACLNQCCQLPLNGKVPVIAVACSGGGYRAMLYATGALVALSELQLMDALSYVVGLSGSTWAIGTWISSGKSIQEFHDWVINNIDFNITEIDDTDLDLITRTLATKYMSGQPVGFFDVYGACIANDLFDFFANGDKEQVYLSNQSTIISDGSLPMPIYPAISAESNASEQFWYEFTPYEVGGSWLNAYVPTWAFGRKFNNGSSVTNAPEQSLGTMFGTFGLAVGVTLENLFQQENIAQNIQSPLAQKILQQIMAEFGNDRAISAEYLNFVFGMPNTNYGALKIVQMVDAGIYFNLPYPPISGQRPARKADIIIFVDASEGTVGAELQSVQDYAQANNLPFPEIDYTNIGNNAVSIFSSDDSEVPVVIYIPQVVDQALLDAHQTDLPQLYSSLNNFNIDECCDLGEACNTFNFSYIPAQAQQVADLGEFNMLMAKDAIMQAITIKSVV